MKWLIPAGVLASVYLLAQTSYNCSALHAPADPLSPPPGSCLGYSTFNIYQSWQLSVLSTVNGVTLWGPQAYAAQGQGICYGAGPIFSINGTPSFYPLTMTTATNYIFSASVFQWGWLSIMGYPWPIWYYTQTSPAFAPVFNCPVCIPPPPPSTPCSVASDTWQLVNCQWQCLPGGSPIILDVDGAGFHLTNQADGVPFNFFGTGLIQISWTARGSTNAWLVYDRNHNGRIDDATELFGNLTPQPPCVGGRNGFNALAVFDANHDGVIDTLDPIYHDSYFGLWQDLNHDGVMQPEEFHSLADLGVKAISLDYHEMRWTDPQGNTFRYRSHVWGKADDHIDRTAYDVFLSLAP